VATDPTTEQLLADLAATTTAGFYVDGAYYFDWSGKAGDGEVGDNVLMEAGSRGRRGPPVRHDPRRRHRPAAAPHPLAPRHEALSAPRHAERRPPRP
jgi:hypothetical protein